MSTIEFSLVQVAVLEGLKQGNDVLKEIHKEMNIDNVERLLEQTQEAQAYQRVRALYRPSRAMRTLTTRRSQEIDDMLMSQMTADEEEAVQEELAELVRLTVRRGFFLALSPRSHAPCSGTAGASTDASRGSYGRAHHTACAPSLNRSQVLTCRAQLASSSPQRQNGNPTQQQNARVWQYRHRTLVAVM